MSCRNLVAAPYTTSPSCVYTASGEYICGGKTPHHSHQQPHTLGGGCSSFFLDTYDAMKHPQHPQQRYEDFWRGSKSGATTNSSCVQAYGDNLQ